MSMTNGHEESATTSTMDEQGAGVAVAVKEQAGAVAATSKEEAVAVAQDAAAHARGLVDRSRTEVKTRADEHAHQLADTLSGLGRELTDVAHGNAPAEGAVADLAGQLGSTVSRLGQRLQDDGIDGALGDIKNFARRRPGAFLLASMGLGVVCGRLLRTADTKALVQAAKPTSDSDAAASTPTGIGTPAAGASVDPTGLGL